MNDFQPAGDVMFLKIESTDEKSKKLWCLIKASIVFNQCILARTFADFYAALTVHVYVIHA